MPNSNKTKTFLADYQAPTVSIDRLDLNFDLWDEYTIVTSHIEATRINEDETITLVGEALTLESVTINGQPCEYQVNEDCLTISNVPATFHLDIVTKIFPEQNHALSGLYYIKGLYCTQCEAEGFRRITYFWDRPDVLTRYTCRINADQSRFPVLLSNGNCIDAGDLADGRHWTLWQDPFKKPTYLFAMVAGDLAVINDQFRTMSGRDIALSLYCDHGYESQCHHAIAALKRAMAWDEQKFGREYDLDQFMIVAVDAFNMGAMENKGLNIFNAQCVLADQVTATDADAEAIESVVAHEYFHNWTGNRVTCRDWFQLSLKEGLTVFRDQEFTRDIYSRHVNRIKDAIALRQLQFAEDASPLAHPVRPTEYIDIDNFYTQTIYEKGAELVRMQQQLLGVDGFRKGMDLYFERHDGQAVTIDDFVAAMADANAVDLSQFKRWYDQPGTPTIIVSLVQSGDRLVLHFEQKGTHIPLQAPLMIPINFAVFDHEGKRMKGIDPCVVLTEAKQSLTIEHAPTDPVISLLREFSAPVIVTFEQPLSKLATLVRCESDGFARYEAMQTIQRQALMERYYDQESSDASEIMVKCIESLMKQSQKDPALTALLILPPNFDTVSQGIEDLRIHDFIATIDSLTTQIKQALQSVFLHHYQHLHQERSSLTVGQRHLKNVLLAYLAYDDQDESLSQAQFDSAQNMTDYLAAFQCLLNKPAVVANQVCDRFFHQWQTYPLVIDKWFAAQATARSSDTWQRVKELMNHASFDLKNPNRLRSLIGSFCRRNPRHFHHAQVYHWISELIHTIDQFNPSIASRLVTVFSQWHYYSQHYRTDIQAALLNLQDHNDLSAGCREMLSKTLSSLGSQA